VVSPWGFIGITDSFCQYQRSDPIFFPHPFDDDYFTALKGLQKLLKAVKNNCELLLFGHEHKYGIWWDHKGVPLIASSHKSSLPMSGSCLMGTIIEINNVGTQQVFFNHRLVTL
jgi:hypothetical protein